MIIGLTLILAVKRNATETKAEVKGRANIKNTRLLGHKHSAAR